MEMERHELEATLKRTHTILDITILIGKGIKIQDHE
jgi:hypothetical protein